MGGHVNKQEAAKGSLIVSTYDVRCSLSDGERNGEFFGDPGGRVVDIGKGGDLSLCSDHW